MNSTLTPRRARALIALVWMALGLLLLCTPLAWPSRALGFTTLFWLVGAPACVLLALKTRAPRPARVRRRARGA